MKKILSLVLAALMIFSVLPAAFAADVETIANIEETSEYAEAIKFLNTLKVYNGKANGDLAADEGVERWQAARFIYRVATGDVAETDVKTTTNYTAFKDINIGDFDGSSAETLGAIAWAAQAKITNGTAADKFSPVDGILYQDAITMIVRLLGERYTAASYPYGFVTTARELGILDGITGIGLEDEISRGVFAQLLYNAIFAPVYNEKTETYETLAGKIFGVNHAQVLLTATNNIRYSNSNSTVTPTNYVGFNVIGSNGEPIGVQYHAHIDEFGLESTVAANAAVGTAYDVYYKNGFAEILSARSLSKVYWNLGDDEMEVTTSIESSGSRRYLTIDGSKYQVVTSYTSLNNNDVWNQDAAANDQVKLYEATGYVWGIPSAYTGKYVIGTNGHIYEFDYTTGTLSATPVYHYVPTLDKYYSVVEKGEGYDYVLKTLDQIMTETVTTSSNGSFKQITGNAINPLNYHNAYAKYTVSDATDDGYADRVTAKVYAFGKIELDNKKKDSSTAELCFKITVDSNFDNALDATVTYDKGNSYDQGVEWARHADYRWTGLDKSNFKKGDAKYVLYYIDNANKEIDVLEVISGAKADEKDSTYVVSGYVRNLNVTTNQLVLEDGTVFTYGYDKLQNSPLKTKDYYNADGTDDDLKVNYKKSNYNLVKNVSKIQNMLNKYVTMYVVDNKVVMIQETSANADYVIIDKFVSFEEDGIVAQAYTTVTDEYTEIKIAAYNGWTVGGFDYYLYFLSNLLGNSNYADALPFELNTIYRVQYQSNGVYNLTDASLLQANMSSYTAGSVNATATSGTKYPLDSHTLEINAYGYITGTDGTDASDDFTKADYKAVSDSDFWLILDPDGVDRKVYAFTGKLNPTILEDVQVYKTKANDYVLVAGENTDLTGISGMFAGSVSYMMFNANTAQYLNDSWLNVNATYNYQILMTNVLTGGTELVTLDPKTVAADWTGYNKAVKALKESYIYKIVDGVLYADNLNAGMEYATGVAVAADYYATTPDFISKSEMLDFAKNPGVNKISLSAKSDWELVKDEIAKQIIYSNYKNWNNWTDADFRELVDAFDGNVTLFVKGEKNDALNVFYKGYLSKVEAVVEDVTDNGPFDVYFVITADNKATGWIVPSNAQ